MWARAPKIVALRAESDSLRHLDVIRFAAAVIIVVYHFRNQWQFAGGGTGQLIDAFENLSLGVDIFFVISGIVMSFVYSDRLDYKSFLQKRFARLAPLHYATFAAYFLIGVAALAPGAHWSEADRFQPQCILPHLTFTNSVGFCDVYAFNHVSWSISAEMVAYLVFPLFLFAVRRSWGWTALATAAFALGLQIAGPVFGDGVEWHRLTYSGGFLRAIIGFLIGMLLYAGRDRLALLPRPRLWLLGLTALFFAGIALGAPRGGLLVVAYCLAAAAYAADLEQRGSYWLFAAAPLSALTYGIYMLHPLVRTLFLPGLRWLGLPNNFAVVACGGLVLGAAWLSYQFFERPMRNLLSPRRVRPEAALAPSI